MSWDGFLKSLETEGGKMAAVMFMLVFIIVIVLLMMMSGHPLQETGKEMGVGAVSSLLPILYKYLNK